MSEILLKTQVQHKVDLKMKTKKPVIIYDGECSLCRGSKDWIARRALPESLEFITCQSNERERRYPHLLLRDCMSAVHIVLPDGRVFAGADAIPHVLSFLKGWRWVAKCLLIFPFTFFARHVYGWIARNRQFISCRLFKE